MLILKMVSREMNSPLAQYPEEIEYQKRLVAVLAEMHQRPAVPTVVAGICHVSLKTLVTSTLSPAALTGPVSYILRRVYRVYRRY